MEIPSTMTEQVKNIEKLDISYRILHPSITIKDEASGNNIEIPFSSLTNKYREFLKSIIISIELDDAFMLKYRFKPKMISEELYGTTEFWNDILILNNCFRTCDFQPRVLKVYDQKKLKSYINQILILEGLA